MSKQSFFKRKSCPFSGENAIKIDYKDVKKLFRHASLLFQLKSKENWLVPSNALAILLCCRMLLCRRGQWK